jgi:ribosomal protein S18 acetylase RimI-like enzyme
MYNDTHLALSDKIKVKKVFKQSDIDTVYELAKNIWSEHFTPIIGKAQVDYMLKNYHSKKIIQNQLRNNCHYFLISHDSNSCGYCSIEFNSIENTVFLDKLYISKRFRRKGIASLILNFFIDKSTVRGVGIMSLKVNKNNTSAINFYKQQGFVITKSISISIGDGFVMDDYVMEIRF